MHQIVAVLAALTLFGVPARTPRPVCVWHHDAGLHHFWQTCRYPKHKRHPVDPRWTKAGPDKYPAPRIG